MSYPTRLTGLLAAVLATACASVTPDGGFNGVAQVAGDRLGKDARIVRNDADQRALDSLVSAKLQAPLHIDDAVQIALLNNRALQASYWDVGIAQADLVQAGRLQNPSFSFQRTRAGGAIEIDRSVGLNFLTVLTAPLARRIEARRFEQVKLLVAGQMLQHAAATRRAWVEAVAAAQGVAYAKQVDEAFQLSSALTGRMAQVGNSSQLDLAREQAFQADAAAALVRAQQHAVSTREALTRLMGLWGNNSAFRLPERLPDLPTMPLDLPDVEAIALRERLDIQAAQLRATQTAAALGLTRTTRFINVLDLDYVRNSKSGETTAPGYAIKLELPLFDWGTARVAKAEALYMQQVNTVAQAAIDARSEARQAYLDYRSAYQLAHHYRDQVIPFRKKIADETMLRYNGMLMSVFELLADSRAQAAAVNGYIDALRDFWLAQTRLEAALGGRLPPAFATPLKGQP
ncbi:TolC family protein [Massilia sp. S19_KUP03_FR1]|uniref:TolC family protein n=1 Tax=Massilia sp. S19_KUP03_FR1 TaxID=3025503 RepID=UPI002FCDADF0